MVTSKRDFSYYAGQPVSISGLGWVIVTLASVLGVAVLILAAPIQHRFAPALGSGAAQVLSVAGFVIIPLIGLAVAAGRRWAALLSPPRWTDILVGLTFVPVVWIASFVLASLILKTSVTSANPAIAMLTTMGWTERASFLASSLPQLFGEELVTILPFLAILALSPYPAEDFSPRRDHSSLAGFGSDLRGHASADL